MMSRNPSLTEARDALNALMSSLDELRDSDAVAELAAGIIEYPSIADFGIDIVWLPGDMARSRLWQGSELAAYRRKHWIGLRRELQRHALLVNAQAVPPSAWLDDAWSRAADPRGDGARLFRSVGPCSPFFDRLLDEYHPPRSEQESGPP